MSTHVVDPLDGYQVGTFFTLLDNRRVLIYQVVIFARKGDCNVGLETMGFWVVLRDHIVVGTHVKFMFFHRNFGLFGHKVGGIGVVLHFGVKVFTRVVYTLTSNGRVGATNIHGFGNKVVTTRLQFKG